MINWKIYDPGLVIQAGGLVPFVLSSLRSFLRDHPAVFRRCTSPSRAQVIDMPKWGTGTDDAKLVVADSHSENAPANQLCDCSETASCPSNALL